MYYYFIFKINLGRLNKRKNLIKAIIGNYSISQVKNSNWIRKNYLLN